MASLIGGRHTASGLTGVDETLEEELDVVQAAYFSPASNTTDVSSDSATSESSDDEENDTLFDRSSAPRQVNEDSHGKNENDDTAEVSDEAVSSFLKTTCSCHVGHNEQPCSNLFTEGVAMDIRSQCMDLTSDQLDMLILGNIASQTKDSGKKRCRSKYFFRGHQICRKTFLFLHCISKKRLENLKYHLKSNGLTSRVHGNTKHAPHNRTPHALLKHVVTFIENYAERGGLSLPGRVPGYKSFRIKLDPTSTSKADLWRIYKAATEDEGFKAMGYTRAKRTLKRFPVVKMFLKTKKLQPLTNIEHTFTRLSGKGIFTMLP